MTIVDGNGVPLGLAAAGAEVTATWTWNGSSADGSRKAGADGTCTVSYTLPKRFSSVTLTITGITLAGYEYDGSNPSITVFKP